MSMVLYDRQKQHGLKMLARYGHRSERTHAGSGGSTRCAAGAEDGQEGIDTCSWETSCVHEVARSADEEAIPTEVEASRTPASVHIEVRGKAALMTLPAAVHTQVIAGLAVHS